MQAKQESPDIINKQALEKFNRFVRLLNEKRTTYEVLRQAFHLEILRDYCLNNKEIHAQYLLLSEYFLSGKSKQEIIVSLKDGECNNLSAHFQKMTSEPAEEDKPQVKHIDKKLKLEIPDEVEQDPQQKDPSDAHHIEIVNLTKANQLLQNTIDAKNKIILDTQLELNELKTAKQVALGKLSKQKQVNIEVQEDNVQQAIMIDQLHYSISQQQTTIEKLKQQNQNDKQEITHKQLQLLDVKKEKSSLQGQLTKQKNTADNLQSQLDQQIKISTNLINKLGQQDNNNKTQISTITDNHNNQITFFKKSIHDYNAALNKYEATIKNLSQDLSNEQSNNSSLNQQLQNLADKNKTITQYTDRRIVLTDEEHEKFKQSLEEFKALLLQEEHQKVLDLWENNRNLRLFFFGYPFSAPKHDYFNISKKYLIEHVHSLLLNTSLFKIFVDIVEYNPEWNNFIFGSLEIFGRKTAEEIELTKISLQEQSQIITALFTTLSAQPINSNTKKITDYIKNSPSLYKFLLDNINTGAFESIRLNLVPIFPEFAPHDYGDVYISFN